MKKKIAVFGSAFSEPEEVVAKAREVGAILAEHDVTIITGACTGLPYEAALSAYRKNKPEIWGFSPAKDYEEQVATTPGTDNAIYSKLFYVPADFPFVDDMQVNRKYRNVISTATCDAGIIISGRWGTLNEFTNLYDMGKVIGVLTGTGDVADALPALQERILKPSKATVIFNDSPARLIEQVMEGLKAVQWY